MVSFVATGAIDKAIVGRRKNLSRSQPTYCFRTETAGVRSRLFILELWLTHQCVFKVGGWDMALVVDLDNTSSPYSLCVMGISYSAQWAEKVPL